VCEAKNCGAVSKLGHRGDRRIAKVEVKGIAKQVGGAVTFGGRRAGDVVVRIVSGIGKVEAPPLFVGGGCAALKDFESFAGKSPGESISWGGGAVSAAEVLDSPFRVGEVEIHGGGGEGAGEIEADGRDKPALKTVTGDGSRGGSEKEVDGLRSGGQRINEVGEDECPISCRATGSGEDGGDAGGAGLGGAEGLGAWGDGAGAGDRTGAASASKDGIGGKRDAHKVAGVHGERPRLHIDGWCVEGGAGGDEFEGAATGFTQGVAIAGDGTIETQGVAGAIDVDVGIRGEFERVREGGEVALTAGVVAQRAEHAECLTGGEITTTARAAELDGTAAKAVDARFYSGAGGYEAKLTTWVDDHAAGSRRHSGPGDAQRALLDDEWPGE